METHMLIRRPVEEVFKAFTDPKVTAKIWFTKSSGKVEEGAELTWEWAMYGISSRVRVDEVQKNKCIRLTWNLDSNPSTVEWHFLSQKDESTFVTIINTDYKGSADDMVAEAIGSMGGFSFLLASAKALLEHGVELHLVADHQPADR